MKFFTVLLLLPFPLAVASDDVEVSVSISPAPDGYVFRLENDHSEGLKISPFQLGEDRGFLLYAYEPGKKELLQAFVLSFPARMRGGAGAGMGGFNYLQPGVSLSRYFSRQRVRDHFFELPDCYFLVLVYRNTLDGVLVKSKPSNPVWVCDR